MNKSNSIQIVIVSILSIMLLVTPAASQNVPGFPMLLHGEVEVNGQAAPIGTIVAAFDADTDDELGRVSTQVVGQYGDPTKLAVNEPSGVLIKYYIKTPTMSHAVEASQTTDVWQPGVIVKLNLSATYVEGTSGKNLGGGSSGSSSGVISSTDTVNDDTSAAGGSGGEAGDIVKDTPLSPDSDGSTDSKDKSPVATIVIAIIIVIAALGALFYIRSKNL